MVLKFDSIDNYKQVYFKLKDDNHILFFLSDSEVMFNHKNKYDKVEIEKRNNSKYYDIRCYVNNLIKKAIEIPFNSVIYVESDK